MAHAVQEHLVEVVDADRLQIVRRGVVDELREGDESVLVDIEGGTDDVDAPSLKLLDDGGRFPTDLAGGNEDDSLVAVAGEFVEHGLGLGDGVVDDHEVAGVDVVAHPLEFGGQGGVDVGELAVAALILVVTSLENTDAETEGAGVGGGEEASPGSSFSPLVDHGGDAGEGVHLTAHGLNHDFGGVDDEDDVGVVARSEAAVLAGGGVPVAVGVLVAVARSGVLIAALVAACTGVELAVDVRFAGALDGGRARRESAGTRGGVILPSTRGSVGAVELGSVVGTGVDDFAGSGLPRAERALVAVVLVTVAARIFVAGVHGGTCTVDHFTDVCLVALFLDQGAAFVADSLGAPQAAVFVLAFSGVGDVGAVVTAAASRVEVDGVPGAVVDGVVEAGIFGPVEAGANHAEVAGVDNAAFVGAASTQVGAVQAEFLKTDRGIGGDDPVAESGSVDGAEGFGVVDGALVVAAAVQTNIPCALGVSIAGGLSDVLGLASLVLAECVGGVVETFLSGGSAGGGTALEGARVRDASTGSSRVEGILVAGENAEVIDLAVGASVAGANLGRVEGDTVEVGATAVVGALSDDAGVPLAASALVALVGLIHLGAVFGGDAELGADERGGIADTIEDLVVDVGEESVSVVFGGRRGSEAHQPLLVLEVFAGDLSALVKKNLSAENRNASVLEGLSSSAGVFSVISLRISENESDLLAAGVLGGSEDVLGLVESGSHQRSVAGCRLDVLADVVVDVIEEFVSVTGECSLGTERRVGDDGSRSSLELNEANTHTRSAGGSGTGLGVGEGGGPDPLLEEGVQCEPTVVGATNLSEDTVGDTVDDDEVKRSATNLEATQAAEGRVHPEAARVSRALAGRGEVLARLVDAGSVGVVGLGLPHALRFVVAGAGVRTVVRAVGDAAHGRRDGVIPVASAVGAFAGEFVSPLGALAFRADVITPLAESVSIAITSVVVGAGAFTAFELLGVGADGPGDGAAVVEVAGSFRSVDTELFTASLRLGEPFAVFGGVSRARSFGSVKAVTLTALRRVQSEVPLAEAGRKSLAIVEVGDGARVLNALGCLSSTAVPLAGLSGSVLLDHAVIDVGETSALVEAALLLDVVPGAGVIVVAGGRSGVLTDLAVAERVGGRPFASVRGGSAGRGRADGGTFGVTATGRLLGNGEVVAEGAVDLLGGG